MSRSILAACTGALVLLLFAARVQGDIEGDRFVSPAWRVRISAPKNWQLTDKTAYPSVLLRMVRRAPDGKMLLTAERLKTGTDALAYANQTIELLRRMSFRVRAPQLHSFTGAYFVDSQREGAYLRQAFLVAGGIGYSLTLAAPDNRTRSQHLRAFEYALRSIQIMRAEEARAAEKAAAEKAAPEKAAPEKARAPVSPPPPPPSP